MTDSERSESGSPIYRHQARDDEQLTPPEDAATHLEAIEAHLEKHVGKVETVFHELLSDLVHLDVLFLPAHAEMPHHTLVTSGVSDKPMDVPEGMEQVKYAELMISLPADWPLDQKSFKDEAHYWPIRWLKMIGRLPHQYNTWIGWGHTIPNGDPAEPIANTQFTGAMLVPPYWLPPEFFQLPINDDDQICFYNLVPLYSEELDLKLKKGADALEALFEKHEIGHVVDKDRWNVARKTGWFG